MNTGPLTRTMSSPLTQNQFFSQDGFIGPVVWQPRRNLSLPPSETSENTNSGSPSLLQRIFSRNDKTGEEREHLPSSPIASDGEMSYFGDNTNHNHGASGPLAMNNHSMGVEGYQDRRGSFMNAFAPENFGFIIKNAFYLILLAVFAYSIVMLHHDITHKKDLEIEARYAEKIQCAREYDINKCAPETRVSAQEEGCLELEKCMRKDPVKEVEHLRIIMHIIGAAFSEFVGRMSVMATAVFLVIFFLILKYGVNSSPKTHHVAQDFRRTTEYDAFHSRLQKLERLSAQKEKQSRRRVKQD